jgi:TonB family protein
MTPGSFEPAPWSRRRWLWTCGGVVVIQVALTFWLSDRSPLRRSPQPREVSVVWMVYVRDSQWNRWLALQNPTLFALPGARGLSGLALPPGDEARPAVEDSGESPHWLAATSHWFDAHLSPSLPALSLPPRGAADKPVPEPTRSAPPPVPVPDRSLVELDAALAARGLVTPLAVSPLTHSNLLSATVVQVGVDPAGAVSSAVVLRSSGLKSADERSLELAARARFSPAPAGATAGGWLWGRMLFRWHSTPAAAEAPTERPP